MIFFPSYQYMEQVEYAVEDVDFPADLLVQGQGMKEQERQGIPGRIRKAPDHSLCGILRHGRRVLGGDRPEGRAAHRCRDRRNGTPDGLRGTGGSQGYFEEKEEAGFDFAYQYPGMNKVLQAAGRVIRTTEGRGNHIASR